MLWVSLHPLLFTTFPLFWSQRNPCKVKDDSGETLHVEIVAVNRMARFLMTVFVLLPKRLGDSAKVMSTDVDLSMEQCCCGFTSALACKGLNQRNLNLFDTIYCTQVTHKTTCLVTRVWFRWYLMHMGKCVSEQLVISVGLRIIVAMLLAYIGCRWLAATQSFGDLILNALALEFAPWQILICCKCWHEYVANFRCKLIQKAHTYEE